MHPFLDRPKPVAMAHRGGAETAPENTMPAFETAVELGYLYLETDAHLTRDGAIVAFHDERLDGITDREGAIAELDLADVEAADAAWSFKPPGGDGYPLRGQGVTVPRMEDLLRRFPEARFNIDPKSDAVVDPLAKLIDALDAWDRVCLGAFSDARMARMRELSGGRACTSMGPRATAAARLTSLVGRMSRHDADCLQVPLNRGRVPIVTPGFVEAAHRAGLHVHVWTINDEPTMNRLLDMGVNGVMTDRLGLLRDVFERRGLRVDGSER